MLLVIQRAVRGLYPAMKVGFNVNMVRRRAAKEWNFIFRCVCSGFLIALCARLSRSAVPLHVFHSFDSHTKTTGVVTFPLIGKHGRTGNQLFQIAATVGVAERNGLAWDFPAEIENCNAGKLFNLKPQGSLPTVGVITHAERSQLYYDVVLEANHTHHCFLISGYFQSLRYFEQSLDSLKSVFRISENLLRRVKSAMKHIDLDNSIGVHVRRGDYIRLNKLYRVLDDDYYLSAISVAKNRTRHNGKIIIVSDDVQWCKDHLVPKLYLHQEVVFSPFSNDELLDFVLLYLTRHNVIANSSFSWWAAFLKRLTCTLFNQGCCSSADSIQLDWKTCLLGHK